MSYGYTLDPISSRLGRSLGAVRPRWIAPIDDHPIAQEECDDGILVTKHEYADDRAISAALEAITFDESTADEPIAVHPTRSDEPIAIEPIDAVNPDEQHAIGMMGETDAVDRDEQITIGTMDEADAVDRDEQITIGTMGETDAVDRDKQITIGTMDEADAVDRDEQITIGAADEADAVDRDEQVAVGTITVDPIRSDEPIAHIEPMDGPTRTGYSLPVSKTRMKSTVRLQTVKGYSWMLGRI